MHACDLVVVC